MSPGQVSNLGLLSHESDCAMRSGTLHRTIISINHNGSTVLEKSAINCWGGLEARDFNLIVSR